MRGRSELVTAIWSNSARCCAGVRLLAACPGELRFAILDDRFWPWNMAGNLVRAFFRMTCETVGRMAPSSKPPPVMIAAVPILIVASTSFSYSGLLHLRVQFGH